MSTEPKKAYLMTDDERRARYTLLNRHKEVLTALHAAEVEFNEAFSTLEDAVRDYNAVKDVINELLDQITGRVNAEEEPAVDELAELMDDLNEIDLNDYELGTLELEPICNQELADRFPEF